MTWIKICGTTNLEDAQLSIAAGADALGFIFAESPRRISPPDAKKIVAELRKEFKRIRKVGVFVNETIEKVRTTVIDVGLDTIQLHGDETPDYIKQLKYKWAVSNENGAQPIAIYKTFKVKEGFKEDIHAFTQVNVPIDAVLLDTAGNRHGGTGEVSNWGLISNISRTLRIILAGGLSPDNVQRAIRETRPFGVDVVSGVERASGKKDPAKLKAFVQAVRDADKNQGKNP